MAARPEVLDWITPNGAHGFIEFAMERASEVFRDKQELIPMALILAKRNPKTRMSFKIPQVVPMLVTGFNSGLEKDRAAEMTKRFCRRAEAYACAWITESWTISPEDAAEAAALAYEGRLFEHPRRIEIVSIMYQHKLVGHGLCVAEIIRGAGGPAVLGPWRHDREGSSANKFSGRFANFLSAED